MAKKEDTVLSSDLAALLLEANAPIDPGADAADRIRARLAARVNDDRVASESELVTVSGDSGEWIEPVPGNRIKVLRTDDETMTMMVHLEPGTTFPAHYHPTDEETYVVDGETWFGDLHLTAGDYHLAPKGTYHGEVRTEHGCVLLIRKVSE